MEPTTSSNGSVYIAGSNAELQSRLTASSIENHQLQVDPNPIIVNRPSPPIEQIRNINIKLLKPPAQHSGDIVVHQEPDVQLPPLPPKIIRERPHDQPQSQLPPFIIREQPPPMLPALPEKHITLPGKILPAPDRQVILERLPQQPPRLQDVIIERWVDPDPMIRNVRYEPAPPCMPARAEKNILIQWNQPEVIVKDNFNFLGVQQVDPRAYMAAFGGSLTPRSQIPQVPLPNGLAGHNKVPTLAGDLEILQRINLNCHGLSEYADQVGNQRCSPLPPPSAPQPLNPRIYDHQRSIPSRSPSPDFNQLNRARPSTPYNHLNRSSSPSSNHIYPQSNDQFNRQESFRGRSLTPYSHLNRSQSIHRSSSPPLNYIYPILNARQGSSPGCLNMNGGVWQRCKCSNCHLYDTDSDCVSSSGRNLNVRVELGNCRCGRSRCGGRSRCLIKNVLNNIQAVQANRHLKRNQCPPPCHC